MPDRGMLSGNYTQYVKAYMAYAIALSLKRSPMCLPQMDDEQLWLSYKLAVQSIPDIKSQIPKELEITVGEQIALNLGVEHDTPNFPAGGCIGEIFAWVEPDNPLFSSMRHDGKPPVPLTLPDMVNKSDA